jgi:hypothetical protein
MPYGAFALTVIAPPAWPLLAAELALAEGVEAEPDEVALMPAGTAVDVEPSSTSTCPAATELAAVAVVAKYPAIFFALATAPAP